MNQKTILLEKSNTFDNNTHIFSGKGSKLYQNCYPIDLIFETVHPDDLAENFIMSYFVPDFASNISYPYRKAYEQVYCRGTHQHNYFELVYVIKGEMYQLIENKRHLYPEGSLCLLNRNIHHTEEFSTDFRAAFLSIPTPLIEQILADSDSFFFSIEQNLKETLQERFFTNNLNERTISMKEYIDFIPFPHNDAVNRHMYSLFEQITSLFAAPNIGSTYLIKGLILQIFYALANPKNYQTIPINVGTDFEAIIFEQLSQMLETEYGRISRSKLEKELNYTGAYLNKIVKKYTGLTIFDYGMTFCMKEAKNLLLNSNLSISEIAETLKFTNRTHFYKIFKLKYGNTPKEYRRYLTTHC